MSFLYLACGFVMLKISEYGDVRMVFAYAFLLYPSTSLYLLFAASKSTRFIITVVSPLHAYLVWRKQPVIPQWRVGRVVALLFVLFVPHVVGYFIWRQEAPKIMSKHYDVTIGGVAYRIPKSYVASISFKSPGIVEHVSIEFSYPDMEPLTKMSAEERNKPGFGRKVRLLVQTYDKYPNIEKILKNMHNAGMASRSEIDYSVDGLQNLPPIKPLRDDDDRYVLIRNSLPVMILSCVRPKEGINPACQIDVSIHPNISVEGFFCAETS
ncbi:MAG: hypothetical protein HQM00_09630 [Magnetococcales bacterium]|nr:hypothetical protein [Magnetococcales bacterium]